MRASSFLFRTSFLLVLLGGLLNTLFYFSPSQRYNIIAFDFIVYFWILAIFLSSLRRARVPRRNFILLCVILLYLVVQGVLFSHATEIFWLEFLTAYKWLVLMILLLSIRTESTPLISIADINFLISIFTVKYFFDGVLFNIWRPGLFGENNFEQPLIFLLLAYMYAKKGRLALTAKAKGFFLLGVGGSKSTVLGVFAGLISNFNLSKRHLYYFIVGAPVALILTFLVVVQKLDFDNIDRINFAISAYVEISQHSVSELFLGTWPLAPLSTETCSQLSFYHELITSVSENLCYSRVFHGFLLRILHDHGLVSLIIFVLIYKRFRTVGFDAKISMFIVLVILANSLSVSGLNNHFIVLGMAILLNGGNRYVG